MCALALYTMPCGMRVYALRLGLGALPALCAVTICDICDGCDDAAFCDILHAFTFTCEEIKRELMRLSSIVD